MPLRAIHVFVKPGYAEDVRRIAEEHGAFDYHRSEEPNDDVREIHTLLAGPANRQALLDDLQGVLAESATARIVIQSVEAAIPPLPEDEKKAKAADQTAATREELYNDVAQGGRLSVNFFTLTFLSSVVAAIGLLTNNVAVVIGAMVIAPLLGPNLAFSFGCALGDRVLMGRAVGANLSGLSLALFLGLMTGFLWPNGLDAPELLARTDVGVDGIALALASGAAAVLSLTSGLSSALVGVMVAVALLPPALTLGIMAGAGNLDLAWGAALLLTVNVVCVNLAALLVFQVKGIKPRTWWEQRQAKQSMLVNGIVWVVLLCVLTVIILAR